MILTLECSTGDGAEVQLWPKPTATTLVGIDINVDLQDASVYLTEEQVITLIQYLETLIVGGSHVECP